MFSIPGTLAGCPSRSELGRKEARRFVERLGAPRRMHAQPGGFQAARGGGGMGRGGMPRGSAGRSNPTRTNRKENKGEGAAARMPEPPASPAQGHPTELWRLPAQSLPMQPMQSGAGSISTAVSADCAADGDAATLPAIRGEGTGAARACAAGAKTAKRRPDTRKSAARAALSLTLPRCKTPIRDRSQEIIADASATPPVSFDNLSATPPTAITIIIPFHPPIWGRRRETRRKT